MEEVVKSSEKLRTYIEGIVGRTLTETEFLEQAQKLEQLFSLLIEIDQRQKKKMREGGGKSNE